MSLISVCCFDTIENNRTDLTEKTLISLKETVDFSRHRLFIFDNASCYDTKRLLKFYQQTIPNMQIITSKENVGTAKGINACWANRREKEHCAKVDNDIKFNTIGWLDMLEESIERMPTIGQAACKRRDLAESPDNEISFYKSELIMLPHEAGQKWYACEKVSHTMGSALLHNYRLIDTIGGLYQMEGNSYGFDDSAYSVRCNLAGFSSVFICGIDIEHMDVQGDDGGYTKWKQDNAGEKINAYNHLVYEYKSGIRSIYHEL